MLNNESNGERIRLPAFYINAGRPAITTISSLEDANKFISERIGTDGTFACYLGEEIDIVDDMYSAIWQVVGVDTELGKGDTPLTQHHISLVPKNYLRTGMIHNNNIDCQGYANSDIHQYALQSIVARLENVLGNHLLTRRVKLTNATYSDTSPHTYMASANGYYSVRANLMCQQQVFGTVDDNYGNAYDTGDDTEQLPGFATGKVDKYNGYWWWLRDIYGYNTSYRFTRISPDGSLIGTSVSSYGGVRPLITIG